MSPTLYHFSSTAHLPWILDAGELRPGQNRIGGLPDPDFLWATECPLGDRTTGLTTDDRYRRGVVWSVRFTLDHVGFVRWCTVPALFPQWTVDHVAFLEKGAKGRTDPKEWWCRADALPLACVTAIEVKSFHNNVWKPISPEVTTTWAAGTKWLGVRIGDREFLSAKRVGPQGQDAYEIGRVV